MESEFEEERRRHAETQKICAKKERRIKEVQLQGEEDRKNVVLLQDSVEKLSERCKILKRQCDEAVSNVLLALLHKAGVWPYTFRFDIVHEASLDFRAKSQKNSVTFFRTNLLDGISRTCTFSDFSHGHAKHLKWKMNILS